jgi:hypothetical protein
MQSQLTSDGPPEDLAWGTEMEGPSLGVDIAPLLDKIKVFH